MGTCDLMVEKNKVGSSPLLYLGTSTLVFFFFFFSDLALPYSVRLSQSPTDQVSEGINSLKTLPSMPSEGPNLFIECPVEAEFSSSGGFQIEGLSPNKMAKVHLVLSSMDIRVYSRRKNKPSTSL